MIGTTARVAKKESNKTNVWMYLAVKAGTIVATIPFLVAAIFGLSILIIFNFRNKQFWQEMHSKD
jgi:predicted LPLAT superfamily acyltransferase